jgi:hypothetical protein
MLLLTTIWRRKTAPMMIINFLMMGVRPYPKEKR